MAVEVTRAYLRGRFIVLLGGFVLAVTLGAGLMLWQAQKAKNGVKFAAVISEMAEATGDVLFHAVQLEQSATTAANQATVREQHHLALNRLQAAYNAFELALNGDFMMTESARITAAENGAAADAESPVLEQIKGLPVPAPVRRMWQGNGTNGALGRDIGEVISLADRLDLFGDYRSAAAQRLFAQLKSLANERVRPNLARALDTINDGTVAGYTALQTTLATIGLSIIAAGALIGALVFVPMMRKIAQAHETLSDANASIDDARRRTPPADRAKSEFLANMSHEIRTPMNGVLGMAELLAKTELDMRQRMFTDVIVKSGNALLTIINDILDFSKIDAGQLELHPAPFKLGEAIEDVATLVSSKVAEKDLEMIVRVDPGLPTFLEGDVGRIRQVVTNLVGNSVKFTERGHVLIDVSGTVADGVASVLVKVEDTGIGIPAEKLESVFDKFAQVDASSTRRHEGTGLGLAITSRLVQLMGGRIGVESELGRGSTFWFEVPLPVHEKGYADAIVPVDVSGSRILVIDDNPINRRILDEQLKSWGFDCAAAESGPVGLAFLRRAREIGASVDCVILDYQMPEMTGAAVAAMIREDNRIADLPVIMLTSVDQADLGRLLVEHKISAYLAKPARSSALLETLVTVLQRDRAWKARPDMRAMIAPVPVAAPRPQPSARTDNVVRHTAKAVEILVVEDNEVNQMVFGQILDGLGIGYRLAGNGRIGVELYRSLKPQLILMDVSMPEMNGFEATAAIRRAEQGSGHRTPIVGITAHALKGDRERCIESGMDDYLSKPVSPDALAAKLAQWLPDRAVALSA